MSLEEALLDSSMTFVDLRWTTCTADAGSKACIHQCAVGSMPTCVQMRQYDTENVPPQAMAVKKGSKSAPALQHQSLARVCEGCGVWANNPLAPAGNFKTNPHL